MDLKTLLALCLVASSSGAQGAARADSPQMTETSARRIARETYFWAWPMVNLYNRRLAAAQIPEPGRLGGVLPIAPLNRLAMLHDYVAPQERDTACPNQDVVYGSGALALDLGPVVLQIPDFGDRFWLIQVVDIRTDSFARLGKMYGTPPGYYLLVGPNWKGETPRGITQVIRSPSTSGFVIPRIFLEDTASDRKAIQEALSGIDLYPLSEFDGTPKRHDWSTLPALPKPTRTGVDTETRWVSPETFFQQLPRVLADASPLPGEEERIAHIRALLEAAQRDPALMRTIVDEARKTETERIAPLSQGRSWSASLPHHWTTISNGAEFGTDYVSRTAAAKSNIFVNRATEAKYFYQNLDDDGRPLDGTHRYTVTFAKGQTPPVESFWSLTLYDTQHFFVPNALGRYSLGTKNRGLHYNADGSLTLYVQALPPSTRLRGNWLPAPKGQPFVLYLRAYWPKASVVDGTWTPPAVTRVP